MDISFIIPAYKPVSEWLVTCVRSVIRAAELHPQLEWEILIGDDGSPGNSFNCADELRALSPQIQLFRFPENRGPGAARNDLISRASGRYVIPQDCDDIMLPFDLSRVVKFMDEHPEYVASYAEKYCFNENGLLNECHGDAQSSFCAFFQPRVNINGMFIRRKELLEIGGFMPLPFSRINEDVRLIFRLFEHSQLHFDCEPRVLYRKHSSQITVNSTTGQNDWRWMAQEMLLRHADIVRELMCGRMPYGKDEQQERIIGGLSGALIFLHQADRSLGMALFEEYIRRHPEDFGGWESYMIFAMIHKDEKLFEKVYSQAMEKFAGMPYRQRYFVDSALKNAQMHKRELTALFSLYNELVKQCEVIPETVAANVPKPVRPKYSWNFR